MSTEYLKFDTSSIKELLKQKLNDLETYTEHNYPASDTALLIDLFSWTFSVMNYILNQNAAEVLFADSTSYENMNRLSKLLSYKPKAYIPATAEFSINAEFDKNIANATLNIPKFTSIRNNAVDSSGNQVCYSFTKDYQVHIVDGRAIVPLHNPVLTNGKFAYYEFENKATGNEFETFVMIGITPDDGIKVCEGSLHVYVTKADERTGIDETIEYVEVESLIADASENDTVFEARLNEDKEYMIKFGDGFHGKKLEKGSTVSVIYLKANSSSSALNVGQDFNGIFLDIEGISSVSELVNKCFGNENLFLMQYGLAFGDTVKKSIYTKNANIILTSTSSSSTEKGYEDVDEIREYAPFSFRLQNRIVTANDYRIFLLNNFSNIIDDAYVCNNNEYCSTFYKWLDNYGMFNTNIRLYNYEYADACNFNNIYIWLQPNENAILNYSAKQNMLKKMNDKKTLTSNLVLCDAVKTYYTPFIIPKDADRTYSYQFESMSAKAFPAKIQIKRLKSYISDAKIIENVASIIVDYFKEKQHLKQEINIFDLQQRIMALGYIDSIRTVCKHEKYIENGAYRSYINGLAFAKFTPELLENQDFDIVTTFDRCQSFQYPVLLDKDAISMMIEITDENTFTLLKDNF